MEKSFLSSGLKKVIFVCTLFAVSLILFGCTQANTQGNPAPAETNILQNGSSAQASGGNLSVEITNFSFSPASLTVKTGETVVWTNNDSAPHTIVGGEINSPTMQKGGTFSYTFNNKGKIEYHCSIHPSMKGTIIVE